MYIFKSCINILPVFALSVHLWVEVTVIEYDGIGSCQTGISR